MLWLSHLTYTWEPGCGVVVRDDGRGTRLAYLARDGGQATAQAGAPDGLAKVWVPQAWQPGRAWPPLARAPRNGRGRP
jgi:hypothetical protein